MLLIPRFETWNCAVESEPSLSASTKSGARSLSPGLRALLYELSILLACSARASLRGNHRRFLALIVAMAGVRSDSSRVQRGYWRSRFVIELLQGLRCETVCEFACRKFASQRRRLTRP